MASGAPRESVGFQASVLVACLLLVVLREPHLLESPRMWGEEGRIFYAFALHHCAAQVLLTPQVGYFTLFNSVVSLVQARAFEVEAAATVTTWAGLLVQLLPVGLILFTTHPYWSTPVRKVVCALVVVLATPPELWLNTTNSHFILGLCTFLVLVIPAAPLSTAARWLLRGLLVLGNFTGPTSMLLTPAFLLKAYAERSREKYIQAAIQAGCALVQGAVTVHFLLRDNRYNRLHPHDWGYTARSFLIDHFSLNGAGYGATVASAIGVGVAVYVAFLLVRRRASPEPRVFLLAFIGVAVFSTLGSINAAGSPRYGYVPTCILLLLVAGEAFAARHGRVHPGQIAAAVILAAGLGLNAAAYPSRLGEIHSRAAPQWKEEVAKWRADPGHRPRIHPSPWFLEMGAPPGRQAP